MLSEAEMLDKAGNGQGFIAALDQSGGSTPKALRGYGVEEDAWQSDEEMFGLIHQMRQRIIMSPSFNGDKVLGAILFEKTMDGEAGGKPVPTTLREKGIVPFLKVDKGLEDTTDGVQLMKAMPGLDALCARAKALGVFGTKMRSVIHENSPAGIADIVHQQFQIGKQILAAGLMPILEPEYTITAKDRAEGEEALKAEILKQLNNLDDGLQVMLKLSIPVTPNLYAELIAHPKVLRVVALSGGYSTDEACEKLAQNNGMIASFSRGLLQDLRATQSDEEFDRVLGAAIDQIYQASIT